MPGIARIALTEYVPTFIVENVPLNLSALGTTRGEEVLPLTSHVMVAASNASSRVGYPKSANAERISAGTELLGDNVKDTSSPNATGPAGLAVSSTKSPGASATLRVINDWSGVGDTQLSSLSCASLGCADSLRAWHVPIYRNAISRKIINFFIVLILIITIVYLIYYISNPSENEMPKREQMVPSLLFLILSRILT